MNYLKLTRGLGAILICIAAISFLLEGWTTMNGLERYLRFSGFYAAVFVIGEYFKRSSENLSRIFSSLTVVLGSAIAAQLGSFILDKYKTNQVSSNFFPISLPEGAPLEIIIVLSLLILVSMIWRSLRTLESSQPRIEICYFVLTILSFLVPARSSNFHAQILVAMFILFVLVEKKEISNSLKSSLSSLIRFSPIVVLFGRSLLYQKDISYDLGLHLILAYGCFGYLTQKANDSDQRTAIYLIGYLSIILVAHDLREIFSFSNYLLTLIAIEILIGTIVWKIPESSKLGLFLMNLFAWFSFIWMLGSANDDQLFRICTNLSFPLIIIFLSFISRFGFSFASSSTLLIVNIFYVCAKFVRLPIINLWMVLGILGVTLLVGSSFIENPHQRIALWWDQLKKNFE